MKFTITKSDLIKELSLINGIVEKRTTIAILSNMYLKAEGTFLYLKGTDLEVGLTIAIKADIEEEGVVIVSAKKFFEIIKVIPEGEINFWIEEDWLKIQKDQSFYSVNAQVEDNYPAIPDYDFSHDYVILPKNEIADIVSNTMISINNEIVKEKSVNGAYFEFFENELNIVTSNRHTMCLATYKGENSFFPDTDDKKAFILSKKTFQELRKMIQLTGDTDALLMAKDGANIFFKAGSRVLFSRLLSQSVMDFRSFLNLEDLVEILLNTKDIKSAIKELMPLSGQFTKKIIFEFDSTGMVASVQDIEGSVGIVKKPVNYSGERFKSTYNIDFLYNFFSILEVSNVNSYIDPQGEKSTIFKYSQNGVDYTFLISSLLLD